MLELDVGLSHVVTAKVAVVSTKARRAARRDLLSTISRLSLREGLSAPRFALRSRRRKSPRAIVLGVGREGEYAAQIVLRRSRRRGLVARRAFPCAGRSAAVVERRPGQAGD